MAESQQATVDLDQARLDFESSARAAERTWDAERANWDAERANWETERAEWQRTRERLNTDIKAQQRSADARIKQLHQDLAMAQGSEAATRSELERLRALVAKLDEHEELVAQLSAQLKRKDTDITAMEARMRELEGDAVDERDRFASLQESLQDELLRRDIELQRLSNQLTLIRVGSDILFRTASADLSDEGRQTLDVVARVIAEYPERVISVEGHTDSVPIGESTRERYPSNWELSAARAASAVRYLSISGVDASRLRVVGRGEQQPVADNDDEGGRALNRRIEISVLPRDSYKVIKRD